MRDLRQELYENLCANCPQARHCHEECEECDYFVEKLEELEEEEKNNKREELIDQLVFATMQPINKLIESLGFTSDDLVDYMQEYNAVEEKLYDLIKEKILLEENKEELEEEVKAKEGTIKYFKASNKELRKKIEVLEREKKDEKTN